LLAFLSTPSIATPTQNGDTEVATLLVDQHDKSGFITIQAAIDASSKLKEVIILIKPGHYKEKLFITRNNLSLVGSSKGNTVIEYPELRNNWREKHPNDWGAAVINISASDINIVNLSVLNSYGRRHNTDEHQFAIRSFENASRIILHQCNVVADGSDTISLWNKKDGMYYHSYCNFEGHTDMVCPRGWALIENSTFFNHKKSATLWHDGELNQEQKLVVNNSHFDGIEGFWLGRHHYDAQFYLLNSTFSKNMENKALFKKTYENIDRIRANLYGDRYFFYNNSPIEAYPWASNNFYPKKKHLKNQTLEQWVFNGKWQPNLVLMKLSQVIEKTNFQADKFQINDKSKIVK